MQDLISYSLLYSRPENAVFYIQDLIIQSRILQADVGIRIWGVRLPRLASPPLEETETAKGRV